MAQLLPPAQELPFAAVTGVGLAVVVGGRGLLKGVALEETTGLAGGGVRAYVRDGANAAAPLMLPYRLGPNETTRDWFDGQGMAFESGLVVDVQAGTVAGVLFVILEESLSVEGERLWWQQIQGGSFDPNFSAS